MFTPPLLINRRIVARLRTVAVDGRPISFAARREATKTRQWTPRARARRRRRRKMGSRHTTSKDWNVVALFTSGGANHSHRSRVRAERRAVVVEIAPKRYVRALTTLARARESERAVFFAATRRSRGSGLGPIGESSPCGVPTDRRRDAARRACAPHDDCRRCARRARRRPRSISESASLRLPRRSFSRIFGEEETCVPSSPLFANASSMV